MSRIGNRPIKIEEGVKIDITPSKISAEFGSNKGELRIPDGISIKQIENNLIVNRDNNSKDLKSKHGLIARLAANLLLGIKEGFTKNLEFKGTGYRASVADNELVLFMGYSHEMKLPIPEDIKVTVNKNNIVISGIDRTKVGQFAALVREVRPPEVYKGKGIKYKEEIIKRKAGKTATSK